MAPRSADDPYFDLGTHTFPITTISPDAQRWFDRGLAWCYGFNHGEALRCFEHVLEHDPDCAMGWWGIAYANGPFYNKPWIFYGPDEIDEAVRTCHDASRAAMDRAASATAVERDLCSALTARHPTAVTDPDQFDEWDRSYAEAMQTVLAAHPANPDVAALTAEALITRTPWKLWDLNTGDPLPGADTHAAIEVLDAAFASLAERTEPAHAGLCHMQIHTLEMSTTPEEALPAADALRRLVPDSGHLNHMPTHIDVLCGHYREAIEASNRAVAADDRFLATIDDPGFYTSAVCHNWHLLMFAAMLSGRRADADRAVAGIEDLLQPEVLDVPEPHLRSTLEAYYSMRIHVPVRFGAWTEIIERPIETDHDLYPVTIAMEHYARALAFGALERVAEAEASAAAFRDAVSGIGENRRFFNNAAVDVLGVASAMVDGEVTYRLGRHAEAFDHLRRAVRFDDALSYSEPWPWMHPPRHALGALLLEQGEVEEARRVYEADLGIDTDLQRASWHPRNVWSLHGYVECLERSDRPRDTWSTQLAAATAYADVEITASCACRLDCCH